MHIFSRMMPALAMFAMTSAIPASAMATNEHEFEVDGSPYYRQRRGKGQSNRRGMGKQARRKSRPNMRLIGKRARRKHRRARAA